MEIRNDLSIRNLTLPVHKILIENLDKFWLSKSGIVRPLHHPVFSLLFSEFSFALFHKSEPVSYVYAAHNDTKGFIHIIATRPEYYQMGFASLLLEQIEKKARSENLKSLWAYMVPGNIPSGKFFTINGFKYRKELKVSSDEIRILYRKTL